MELYTFHLSGRSNEIREINEDRVLFHEGETTQEAKMKEKLEDVYLVILGKSNEK